MVISVNCPKCGGALRTANEDPEYERRWGMAPHALSTTIHPAAGMAARAANAVRKVANRTALVEKECVDCGHTFK